MSPPAAKAKTPKPPTGGPKGDLSAYKAKRDFSVTPEPAGEKNAPKDSGLRFVIQKHAARRLHYDFRLEMDGVLKSWAVAKGPSLDPADRRLAVHTEDHPMEYGGFEGVIPQGQYGGGTVMLWDHGTWEPLEDGSDEYAEGRVKLRLHGEKLNGGWMLVRMKSKLPRDKGDNWLLIKERDEFARPGETEAFLEEHNRSVTTGRLMEEIAAERDRIWTSNRDQAEPDRAAAAKAAPKKSSARKNAAAQIDIEGATPGALPDFIAPQLATLLDQPPETPDWIHEIKFDGYRALFRIDDGKVQILTRSGQDWTHKFGGLAQAASTLPVRSALIDGEIVILLENGVSSFTALQEALSSGRGGDAVYYAFDLLHLDGIDISRAVLEDRKAMLKGLVDRLPPEGGQIQYSDHIEGQGAEFRRHACDIGLEGIVSKRRDAPYRPGRGGEWVKSKCSQRQEFVIGGFTEPTHEVRGVAALLLGYYQGDKLIYAGKVGTGFTDESGTDVRDRLNQRLQPKMAFEKVPADGRRGAKWVRPELVCEVAFTGWTTDGRLRHPSFQGLREDKDPKTVVREQAKPVAATAGEAAPVSAKPAEDATSAMGKPRERRDEFAGVKLSNPDKVLFQDQNLTKQDLAAYYETVSGWMLPHVVGRPLSLVRCPAGSDKHCFYQRHINEGTPDTIHGVPVGIKGREEIYLAISDLKGLISLVQLGVLEIHPWGAREDDVYKPDRVILDLDPAEDVPFSRVKEAAKEVRQRLHDLGLESFIKTTGGKGLHVVFPLLRKHDWAEAKAFAKAIADSMVRDAPNAYVATLSKKVRVGKIFVDYLRNDLTSTAVAPYSTRSRPTAPVAAPIEWAELDALTAGNLYSVQNMVQRMTAIGADPWTDIGKVKQSISAKALKAVGIKK